MKDETNRQIGKVLEANEFIKSVDTKAILIKINALNALFLAIRSEEHLRGYIVVTDEFNRFTDELSRFVDKLRDLIFKNVVIISTQLKLHNRNVLYTKAFQLSATGDSGNIIHDIVQKNEKMLAEHDREIEIFFSDLVHLLKGNERLVLRGDMLAMQAKIEGAYSIKSRDVFRDVAESFQKHIIDIRDSLQHLSKILGKK
ncbi:MAG: hypothetical protein OEV66_10880 [Spirochaetia bacterium]|nr:hypothetical protein [Spirochaetia bacterium]